MEKGLSITIGITLIILVLIAVAVFFTGSQRQNNYPTTDPDTKGIILFYGEGCPHCKIVEDFMAENDILSKIILSQSEVWHNEENLQLLIKKAQICGLNIDTIGIPLLYDGESKCFSGDQEIINFLKNATDIK